MTAPRRVLVTDGEQRSALAVVRSLGRAGYDVSVGSRGGASLAGASRFARVDISLGDPLRDAAGFAEAVHRVVAAADVGRVVHPDTVVAQIEGGIVFGLGAALYGRIDLDDGAVRQSNFHDYRILSYGETPEIEGHLLESAEPPGGVGEIAVPPIAPAVANALLALTGRPTSRLPLTAQPWS